MTTTGLQGVEGCFDLKSPHGEDQLLPPLSSRCKVVITGLKRLTNNVMCVLQKTNQDKV